MGEPDEPPRRAIRSFVMRAGRMTSAQQKALEVSWPRFGVDFGDTPLDLDALFARRAPRVVEIGFGNGEHLAALAARRPDCDFLGVEVHPPGVGHLLQLIEKNALTNVRVSRHDAVEVLEHQVAPGSLAEVHLLFPDPWHKARHHKRRILNAPFARLVASRLTPGGLFHLATDWEPYAQQMIEVLEAEPLFINRAGRGQFAPRDSRAPTRFERRGERLGHGVWDLDYLRA